MRTINNILIFLALFFGPYVSFAQEKQEINLLLSKGTLFINPKGLEVLFKLKGSTQSTLISASNIAFSDLHSFNEREGNYEITYNNSKVLIIPSKDHVTFKIYPKNDSLINWPLIEEDPKLKTYLVPEGEGLFVPIKDKTIRAALEGNTLDHTNMLPFVGFMYDDFAMTIIENTPYRTNLKFDSIGRGLKFEYDFRKRDDNPFYSIRLVFSESNLLEPSKIFRAFLKENNQFITLDEKIKLNPEIQKLAGAIHIYVWGDARTEKALEELFNIGIKKAWVGYEEKPNRVSSDPWSKTNYVSSKFIESGKKYGYLIGSYDSYNTMQPIETADAYNTDFGTEFYPKGCVVGKNGKVITGFAGRGCTVSMKALDQDNNSILFKRIKKFKSDGVNSYFLDCHGMLEAYDDYSKEHSQTIYEDIAIRLKHMKILSEQEVVLGSEGATAYSIPYLAFSHGNFSTLYNLHYKLMGDKKVYGGWGPVKRPAIFFKTVTANDDYKLRYLPEYRIPLFQSVFHDSIVTTDRWEISLVKFPNLFKDRFLLEFLYGVPSMWNIDLKAIKQYKNILIQLGTDFMELHSKIMTKELSNFEYLTADRKVQKAVFGTNEVTIIANFTNDTYKDIPKKSLKVIYNNMNKIKIIQPEGL